MKIQTKIDGKVAASVTLEKRWRSEWEIAYVKVEPEHRGKRLASELLERAKVVANDRQLTLVAFLDPDGTGLSLSEMKAWLKRHGFKFARYDFGGYTKPSWIYQQLNPPKD